MRLFTLFPNLITKESYNWWVTRRFWGCRQQISKAKYLKISQLSVAHIWKLQENTEEKYLKMLVAHIGKLQENTATLYKNGCKTLQVSAIKWSGYVQPEKLKRPPFPSGVRRCPNAKYPDGMAAEKKYSDGMSAEQNSGCETSGWNVGGVEFRM